MRITVDTRPLLDSTPGGVRTYTLGLHAMLSAAGHEVVSWTNSLRTTGVPNKVLNPLLRFAGWPKVDELVARHAGQPDWFVMPNPNFIALSGKIKLAVVFHDLSFEVNPSWFSVKDRWWHRLVCPRELTTRADRVIAVSEWTKRDLIEIYEVPEEKIAVVPPYNPSPWNKGRLGGVRGESSDVVERTNPSQPSLILREGEGIQVPTFLYLGSLSRRKNVIGLVRAFESVARDLPTARLVLAGPDGYGAEDVRGAVVASSARDRIRLCGIVSEEEKARLLASATAFVYPSFYEGYGIPVVEAMAACVPVIVSNRAALPEVAAGAGLLVDPYDVSTIAHAMLAVATDPVLHERLSRESKARALTLTLSRSAGEGNGGEGFFPL